MSYTWINMDKSLISDCVYVLLGRSDDIESDRSQLITSPSSIIIILVLVNVG